MYIYGAGGHAKVVIEIFEANQITIQGIYDDAKRTDDFLGYTVKSPKDGVSGPLIIAVGNAATRKKIALKFPLTYGKAIYPGSLISPRATIGEGSVVMQGSVIQACAKVGKHCIINTAAVVEHDCVVDDFVHLSSNATLCGGVEVGEGSWIGAGTTVIQGVKIGKWSMIGAGSVVVKDIPDGVLAYGNPCRVIKKLDSINL